MSRLVSYPITRAFTRICIGLALLLCITPSASATDTSNIATLGFEDVGGHTVTLSDFKGKAVIINLWASWCAPCVGEMPLLVSLQEEYKSKGLVVLALSEDDMLADAIKFYKSKSITTLSPYFDKDHSVWMSLKARGLPTTIFIDRNGNVVKTIEGPIDNSSQFQQDINRLVGE